VRNTTSGRHFIIHASLDIQKSYSPYWSTVPTPYYFAAEEGKVPAAQMLLRHDVRMYVPNQDHRPSLQLALQNGLPHVVIALIITNGSQYKYRKMRAAWERAASESGGEN
jgi:hypothetical protein